jgi:hypothetical protein
MKIPIFVASSGETIMQPSTIQSTGNFYALISECQRAAILGQYGDLGVGQLKEKLIETVREQLKDFSTNPYVMISEQNRQIQSWIDEALQRYQMWLDDGKPNL